MAENDDKIKSLPPEERIMELKKRLAKLEEEKKKEIEQATQLIKDSESEIQEKEEAIRKVPLPQMKAVDIDSLFSPEEKEMFKTMRFAEYKRPQTEETKKEEKSETLEESLSGTALPSASLNENELARRQAEYAIQLSLRPADELYRMATDIYRQQAEQGGYLNIEQQERQRELSEAIYHKESAIYERKYKPDSEEIAEKLSLAKRILGYKRGGV